MSSQHHGVRQLTFWRATAVIAVVLTAVQCQVIGTVPMIANDMQTCKSALGNYFLPKILIRLMATQVETQPIQLSVSDAIPDVDRSQAYCLDYLASPLADDTVSVVRDPTGVLTKITSTNADKTKEITLTALDAAVIAVTGNPGVTRKLRIETSTDSATILADYQFDPLDRLKLAEVNSALAPNYGYCAIIDKHTLRRATVQAYCNNPLKFSETQYESASGDASPVLTPDAANRGILYRP